MGLITIPATPADFLKKFDSNFDRKWCRSGFAEWSKQTWDGEEKSPVEIAEEALEVAASRCRVEELLDPIRALVDAKVMEVLAQIRAGEAA